jgi:putative glutamine amidotransferase
MRFALTLNVGFNCKEYYDSLNHSYVSFFQRLGIIPVLVPNVIEDLCSYVNAFDIQGIILTGGNDISPKLYGKDLRACRNVSDIRDRVESKLLQMAVDRKLPVLGICRGMQFINVFFGGSLIQDIQSKVGNTVNHVGAPHINKITNSSIGQILGVTEFTVNSFHNQGVVINSLASTIDIFTVSRDDGLVEGIFHPIYPILGIQWHPERPGSSTECDLCLIKSFLQGIFWERKSL